MTMKTPNGQSRRRGADRGFIGLITVIILGLIILVLGLSASFTGQTQLIIAAGADRAENARQANEACVDEALNRLRLDNGYTGSFTLAVGSVTCSATVSGVSPTKTIAVATTDGSYVQSATVTATRRSNGAGNAKGWGVSAWQEANF